ncbi:hypothetical protein [Methylocystis sp.]|uniref:hypothetical protein n=1 Tax=Methylocystis sp. TaxID=1911079 RepID=UPI003DA59EBB
MKESRSRGTAALILATVCAWPGLSFAEENRPSGFDYCAPPLRPGCIDAPAVTDACETDVQAFIKTVFKYRACLERESGRAVRGANDALEAWKCRTGALKCR